MQENRFIEINSVDDFKNMNILMEKIRKEVEGFQNTNASTETIIDEIIDKARTFVSKLSIEHFNQLLEYFKQHNDYIQQIYSNSQFPANYSCFDPNQCKDENNRFIIFQNQNLFVQFSSAFNYVLNERIVKNYLTEKTLEIKPQAIIDYLTRQMIFQYNYAGLIELNSILNELTNDEMIQKLKEALNERIKRLENIENFNPNDTSNLTLQEAQEILSHINYNLDSKNNEQKENLKTISLSVQSHINNLAFIMVVTNAYITQLEKDAIKNTWLKNVETTQEIIDIIKKAQAYLCDDQITIKEQLQKFQNHLADNAHILQKNRNQLPYLLLKIFLSGIIGYMLYRLLIGSKASNLMKLINHDYRNSLQSKILYGAPNPFKRSG